MVSNNAVLTGAKYEEFHCVPASQQTRNHYIFYFCCLDVYILNKQQYERMHEEFIRLDSLMWAPQTHQTKTKTSKHTQSLCFVLTTDFRSSSISLRLVFLLQREPLFSCTLYWMLWKLTVEPRGCLFCSVAGATFGLAVPLVPMSSIIAMSMWWARSAILSSYGAPGSDSDLTEIGLLLEYLWSGLKVPLPNICNAETINTSIDESILLLSHINKFIQKCLEI